MTIETKYQYIDDLEPTYPEGATLISEGDDHIRGVKSALVGSFPNLGQEAVTKTAAELNAVLTTAGGGVTGTVTFNDENSGFEWDLSGSSPPWAQTVAFTAFTLQDPYVPGNPTVAGLSFNAPVIQVNNPVLPGVTSGFKVYCSSADAAPYCGFEFLDDQVAAPNNSIGGLSVYQNVGGNTDLLVGVNTGELYFLSAVANGGAPISLSDLLALISALTARVAALEGA
jgi:hypothetical protein